MYRMFAEIADPPDEVGLVGALIDSLWARLHIPRTEIKRRMKVGARIRAAAPDWPARRCPRNCHWWPRRSRPGTIGEDHLRVITARSGPAAVVCVGR